MIVCNFVRQTNEEEEEEIFYSNYSVGGGGGGDDDDGGAGDNDGDGVIDDELTYFNILILLDLLRFRIFRIIICLVWFGLIRFQIMPTSIDLESMFWL